MGGFTEIKLKDCSNENIEKQNQLLEDFGVARKYRFYSESDVIWEYEGFVKGTGSFPEHLFPKDKINSYEDFTKYWNTKSLGSLFCPEFGTLTFDCYFGRTSKRAMRNMGKYITDNHNEIEKVSGSFSTFMERGMTRLERQIINEESNIKNI